MNRMLVLGVAAVFALGVAAMALASSGGEGETKQAAVSPTATQVSTLPGENETNGRTLTQEQSDAEDKATGDDARDGDKDAVTGGDIAGVDDTNEIPPTGPNEGRMPLYDDGAGGGTQPSTGELTDKSEYEEANRGGNSSSEVPPDYRDTPISSEDPEPRLPIGPSEPAPMPSDGDRRLDPAPIDVLDIQVMLSFPPQYMLSIQAGLPSGCAEKHSHEWHRSGNSIRVSVLNSMPVGDVACTMIYGMYNLNINLGSDFTPGETYTVYVNDQEISFKAQ